MQHKCVLVLIDQVALLVAGIHYVLEVEATLQRVDGGDSTALGGYHDLQVSMLYENKAARVEFH